MLLETILQRLSAGDAWNNAHHAQFTNLSWHLPGEDYISAGLFDSADPITHNHLSQTLTITAIERNCYSRGYKRHHFKNWSIFPSPPSLATSRHCLASYNTRQMSWNTCMIFTVFYILSPSLLLYNVVSDNKN